MARKNEITLEYEDGTSVTAVPKVRHLVASEEKFGKGPGGTPPLKGTLYAAWLALDRPRGSFGTWMDTIDAVVLPTGDDDDEGPTGAAQGSEET